MTATDAALGAATATGARTSLAPWGVERSLAMARWAGAGVAILQAVLYQPTADNRPGLRLATIALGGALALANVALLPALRRQRVTTTLAALLFTADLLAVCGFLWLYFDNAAATQWVLFMIIQLEAAYRWAMRGALGTAIGSAAVYSVARVVASREFGFDLTIDSFTYVAGLLLVQAFVVGGMAERLRAERDASLELSEASLALNAGLDRKAILTAVAREATRLAGAAITVVWVPSEDGFVPAASHNLPPDLAESVRLPSADPVFGEPSVATAFRTQSSVVLHNAGNSQRPVLESIALPRIWRSVASVPIVHEGDPVGVLSCYSDRRQPPPPEAVARLEALVALCGVALANAAAYERERESLDALKTLDHLKDDFLATVSHELRTPLTVVGGFATTLRSRWADLTDEKRQDLVRRIESQASGLHERIGDLLDFARLQAGAFELRFVEFDVAPLIGETVSRLEPNVAPHPVHVDVTDARCYGDAAAVSQVIENLIVNAARYSAPQSPIDVRAVESDDGTVEIAVVDRGIGVPEEEQQRIWERFYRGQQDAVRAQRGTGVGLSIVKELTEALGGEVRLETAIDQGSTFTLRLPSRAPTGAGPGPLTGPQPAPDDARTSSPASP